MKLTLIETEDAYLVVFDNDPDDWVVRFSKNNHFPAQEWAERMAKLYNLRIDITKQALNSTRALDPSLWRNP